MYFSTKHFTPGLSCAFRQWRATSHCSFLHGYALTFRFTFACVDLDARNWCVDFGALKPLKNRLEEYYDHKTVIASDDPKIEAFKEMHEHGMIDLRITNKVGCEAFAQEAFELAQIHLANMHIQDRVRVHSVEVAEHEGNSAIYQP